MVRVRVRPVGRDQPRAATNLTQATLDDADQQRNLAQALNIHLDTQPLVFYTTIGDRILDVSVLGHDELLYAAPYGAPFLTPPPAPPPPLPRVARPSPSYIEGKKLALERQARIDAQMAIVSANTAPSEMNAMSRGFGLPTSAPLSAGSRDGASPGGDGDDYMAVGLCCVDKKAREASSPGPGKDHRLLHLLLMLAGLVLSVFLIYLVFDTTLDAVRLQQSRLVCGDGAPRGCLPLPEGCQLASPWMLGTLTAAAHAALGRQPPRVLSPGAPDVSALHGGMLSSIMGLFAPGADSRPFLERSNDTLLNHSVAHVQVGACWLSGASRLQLVPDSLVVRYYEWEQEVDSTVRVGVSHVGSDRRLGAPTAYDSGEGRQLALWDGDGVCDCSWTEQHACPSSEAPGSRGYARDDGTFCFHFCCLPSTNIAEGNVSSTWAGSLMFDDIALLFLGREGVSVSTCHGSFERETAVAHFTDVSDDQVPVVLPELERSVLATEALNGRLGDALVDDLCGLPDLERLRALAELNGENVGSQQFIQEQETPTVTANATEAAQTANGSEVVESPPAGDPINETVRGYWSAAQGDEWQGTAVALDAALDAAMPELLNRAEFIIRVLAMLAIFLLVLIAGVIHTVCRLATPDRYLVGSGVCCCLRIEGYESAGAGACCCLTIRNPAKTARDDTNRNDNMFSVCHHLIDCCDCADKCCG